MIDEGVIKFNCDWNDEKLPIAVPEDLLKWRDKMHELKLIGEYPDIKIGYGNISVWCEQGILISGTQTGNTFPIAPEHFALVTAYDMHKNQVSCTGLLKASAESLTHAAFYDAHPSIKAVIHIHSRKLWDGLIDKVPTSDRAIPYGTSAMASEIKRLFSETSIKTDQIMVMGGHDEGLIAFGKDLAEAGKVLLNVLTKFD